MKRYDVIVIGAGSAGLVAATTARRLGATTALVERHQVGGECLHSGCVPSKALVHTARLRERETVFGPTRDGGYYLVGQTAPARDLFAHIPWSTAAVWPLTRQRLADHGWTCALLPELEDIDDLASLERVPGLAVSAAPRGHGSASTAGAEATSAVVDSI